MAIIALPNPTTRTPNTPGLPKGALEITKSNGDTYPMEFALYVGGAGDVVVSPANGNADITMTMAAGSIVPFMITALKSTGTTATDTIAIY
jgi:hypothetical protein